METRRLLWVMPLPSHNKTPGRFQRILVSLSLTLCLCSYKHSLPSPLHAKSVVPHHLIWESDEWKIHRYCDLDNLFQNVSNSPQGSSGMKQNSLHSKHSLMVWRVETPAPEQMLCPTYSFLNSKCLAHGKAPHSSTLPPKCWNWNIQDEALEMQEFDFNSNIVNRGKKSSAEKLSLNLWQLL